MDGLQSDPRPPQASKQGGSIQAGGGSYCKLRKPDENGQWLPPPVSKLDPEPGRGRPLTLQTNLETALAQQLEGVAP
jgi:hypothetical protein